MRAVWLALMLLPSFAVAQLPAGFTDTVFTSGLNVPVGMAFAPDGRLFVTEKNGLLRVITSNGNLLGTPFVTINVSQNSERGLLDVAFDPDFAANQFVYVYYTTNASSINPPATPKNRVSRFTANGNTAVPFSEVILLDEIPSDAGNHNAGCLRFGPDGKLYISTGDGGATSNNSQNRSNLAGKILRINKDGSIPADNPFVGVPGARGEIYCWGLRNPFRFSFRPGSGALYIGDVGASAFEEVNLGTSGSNYGWPIHEGPSSAAGFMSPIYSYPHTITERASITGGVFLSRGAFPPGFSSSYYFGDYVRDEIRRLTVSSGEVVTGDFDFTPAEGPVDFEEGPDGWLYYVSIGTGSVRRIRYKPTLASVTLNPSTVVGGASSTGTVNLDLPAPARGAVVTLSSTAGASVPAFVTIPGGATSRTFKINTSQASSQTDVTITASRMGVVRTAVLTVRPTPNADFISQSVPTTMVAGQSYSISITMLNNGPTTWTHNGGYRLSSYNPANNTTWGTNRIFLPGAASVAPGQQCTFTKTITAPSTPGEYTMQWRMLLNGFRTFGEASSLVTVEVLPAGSKVPGSVSGRCGTYDVWSARQPAW